MFLGPLLLINFTSFELCFHLCPSLCVCVRMCLEFMQKWWLGIFLFFSPPCHLSGLTIVITFKQVETDIRIFSLHSLVGSCWIQLTEPHPMVPYWNLLICSRCTILCKWSVHNNPLKKLYRNKQMANFMKFYYNTTCPGLAGSHSSDCGAP